MRDDVIATTRIIWYGALFVAMATAVAILGWFLYPTQMKFEREAMKNSYQRVEADRNHLLTLAKDYDDAATDLAKYEAADPVKYAGVITGLENQQRATLAKMREIASLMPENEIPQSVQRYLVRK